MHRKNKLSIYPFGADSPWKGGLMNLLAASCWRW